MAILTITEMNKFATDHFGGTVPAPQMPSLAEQAVDIGAESVKSEPFGSTTRLVMLHTDTACCLAFGDATVAALNGKHEMAAGETRFYGVAPGTFVAADTMASHAGWTEITAFSNSTRPALTLGSVSAQAVDNSGSPAVFNINGTTTVLGGFVTTNSTVGGSSGTLYGEAAFANSRTLYNLDTLTVTIQLSAATG